MWKRFARTEIACIIITVVIALGLTYADPENWLGNLASSFIFSHSIGFSISGLVHVFDRYLDRLHPVPRVLLLVFLFLTGAFIGTEVGAWIIFPIFGVDLNPVGHGRILLINLLMGIVFGSVAFVYFTLQSTAQRMAKELREKEINQERLERLKTQAELEALQAKIDPHFLFNTLNSIASLISENPSAAESTVERLSDLFRYTLQRSGNKTVKLAEEMDIVRSYLEIEKIRFGERLQFVISRDGRLDDVAVPPLLLQTLVENSIKHGIAPDVRGGSIAVEAKLVGDRCVLSVADSGKGFAGPAGGSAFGLRSIRERLALTYEGKAEMEISRDTMTRVQITLPML
jgi:two-component system LytT family sensor kinase